MGSPEHDVCIVVGQCDQAKLSATRSGKEKIAGKDITYPLTYFIEAVDLASIG